MTLKRWSNYITITLGGWLVIIFIEGHVNIVFFIVCAFKVDKYDLDKVFSDNLCNFFIKKNIT